MAEEWRLRAEEAWERHLLEGDDDTMREMKDAQRRAKKYEAKMMDKCVFPRHPPFHMS